MLRSQNKEGEGVMRWNWIAEGILIGVVAWALNVWVVKMPYTGSQVENLLVICVMAVLFRVWVGRRKGV